MQDKSQINARKPIFVLILSAPPMNILSKYAFLDTLIIGGADRIQMKNWLICLYMPLVLPFEVLDSTNAPVNSLSNWDFMKKNWNIKR